ncbi:MAG: hypothetical protein PVF68_02725 [Acidobacteriota bacterium]|jgi:hypothetical protein
MIRIFRALVWMRWRVLVHTLRGGSRDSGERISRLLHALAPVFLVALMLPSALGLGALAFWAGQLLGSGKQLSPEAIRGLRLGLGAITAVVVLMPLARARAGGGSLTRMLLLPIPRRLLHVADLAAGIADPWLLAIVPALLLFPLGFATGGSLPVALGLLLASLGLLLTLLALASAASQGVQLLLRDRRRAEALILAATVLLTTAGIVPALLFHDDRDDGKGGAGTPQEETGVHLTMPEVVPLLPSELYVRQLDRALNERRGWSWSLAGLFAQAAIAFGLSGALHRRLTEQPESMSRTRRGARRRVRILRVPGLSPAASAVALAQSRTFLRTVKGKMAVYFGPVGGLLLGLVLIYRLDPPEVPGGMVPPFTLLAGLLCILSLQPILLNLFATDGPGLTLQLLGPISARELVQGKLAAAGFLACLPTLLCGLLAWVLFRDGSFLLWVAALVSVAAVYLMFSPVGAILSALLPRRANLNSMGKDGNPHGVAGLLGTLLTAAAVGPPVLLALFGMLVLDSRLAALLLIAGWTGIAAGIGHVLAGVAAGIVEKRRENLALVAQGR